jgi:TPR repeat protein
MIAVNRLARRLAPALVLVLGACQALDDFARSVDEAAASIIPSDRQPVASESDADLTYRLGLKTLNGDGVARNEAKAAELFHEAAAKGSNDAQLQLGLMHLRGQGVAQDDRAALSWLEKAAAAGNGEAQLLTAQAYATGRGASVDHAWAARWYGKAAEQGDAKAQQALGISYAAAQGLPRDRVAALTWLTLAAAQGNPDAARERDALARKMSKAEIEEADRRAKEWRAAQSQPFLDAPTVRFAQVALADLGFPPGPIDGQQGQRTRAALAAYQAKTGTPGDGALTPAVIEKLRADRLPAASVARSTR